MGRSSSSGNERRRWTGFHWRVSFVAVSHATTGHLHIRPAREGYGVVLRKATVAVTARVAQPSTTAMSSRGSSEGAANV